MHKLTALHIKNANQGDKLSDGGGLRLDVDRNRNRSWIFRFTSPVTGRERFMGMGRLKDVGLAEAREAAAAARKLLRERIDPIEHRDAKVSEAKREAARSVTFKAYTETYIAAHERSWKNPKHRQQWRNSLAKHAYPHIGDLGVAAVDTTAVMTVLRPIWGEMPETASRVRGRIEAILSAAKVEGLRAGDNPAAWRGHIAELLPSKRKVRKVEHHPALPYAELPAFWRSLAADPSDAARLLRFIILTVARFSEAACVESREVDRKRCLWTVPAARMKGDRDHRVPLTNAALAEIGEPDGLIFASRSTGGPLSDVALANVIKRHTQTPATTHGFRSTFRTWAAECTNFPREVIEMALAHAVGDETEQAYQRGDLREKRRKLMGAWSEYCQADAKIVRLKSV